MKPVPPVISTRTAKAYSEAVFRPGPFRGPPGTGKTHMSIALASVAIALVCQSRVERLHVLAHAREGRTPSHTLGIGTRHQSRC